MKYVSKIYNKLGGLEQSAFIEGEHRLEFAGSGERAVGIAPYMYCRAYKVAVRYTSSKAQLMRYVSRDETILHENPAWVDDIWTYSSGFSQGRNSNGEVLTIRLASNEKITCHGNGVVSFNVHDGRGQEFITLYDLLLYLCDMCDINVMQYREIRISSVDGLYCTYIRLDHTAESKRYFMKMYMWR